MAEPGYDQDSNIFTRFGKALGFTTEKDIPRTVIQPRTPEPEVPAEYKPQRRGTDVETSRKNREELRGQVKEPAIDVTENPWLQKPGGATFGASRPTAGPDAPLQTGAMAEYGPRIPNVPGPDSDPGSAIVMRRPDVMAGPDRTEATPGSTYDPASGAAVGSRWVQPAPVNRQGVQATGPGVRGGVTPAGNGPGGVRAGGAGGAGGAGRAPGPRKPLRDQTRTEQFDPILDRADPDNVHVTDDTGRVNPPMGPPAPTGPAQKGGAIDLSGGPLGGQGRQPGGSGGPGAGMSTNNAANDYTAALQGAAKYVTDTFHQGTKDQHTAEGYQALTFGAAGAPPDDLVRGVFAVVDPKNELPMKERMELATKAMYDWYTSKGDTASANKVSAEILQYGNKMAKAYGDQALTELKSGNRAGAIKHLQDGYNFLPDGYHADVQGNDMVISDRRGKVINKLPLDDKTLQNLSTGMATGTLYWDVVQDRAGTGQRFAPSAPPPTQAVTPRPPAPAAAPAPAGPGSQPTPAAPAVPAAPAAPAPPPPTEPVTPPGNQPAPARVPDVLREEPAAAAPTEAITTRPPVPPGVEVSSAKPVEPSEPVKPAPPAPTPGVPEQGDKTTQPKTPATPAAKQEAKLVYKDDNTDDVPTRSDTNKPHIVRRATYEPTPEAMAAATEKKRILDTYARQMDELDRQSTKSKSPQFKQGVAQYRRDIEATAKNAVKEQDDVIKEWRKERDKRDQDEKKNLTPHHLEGEQLRATHSDVNEKLSEYVKQGDKWPYMKNSPLRLYKTENQWAPIRDAVASIKAINRELSSTQITDHVLTAISHVGTDDKAKSESANGKTGDKGGSRFVVIGEDLARNPVIALGAGTSEVTLHVPRATLNEIRRLRDQSFTEATNEAKKAEEDKRKSAINTDALIPDTAAQTYRSVKDVVEGAPARRKELGMEMPPKEGQPDPSKARRRAPSSPTENLEP